MERLDWNDNILQGVIEVGESGSLRCQPEDFVNILLAVHELQFVRYNHLLQ